MNRSFVAAQVIRRYVELNKWQIEQIKKAWAEADRGDFAGSSDVSRVVKKWTRRAH
jgi:RHH-type rel operon transcriptional repressor/antitoxin RelB